MNTLTTGSHRHPISDPRHTHGGRTDSQRGGAGGYNLKSNGGGPFDDWATHVHNVDIDRNTTGIQLLDNGAHSHSITGSTGSTGKGKSFSFMPPYQTIDYIIFTGDY